MPHETCVLEDNKISHGLIISPDTDEQAYTPKCEEKSCSGAEVDLQDRLTGRRSHSAQACWVITHILNLPGYPE